MQVTRRAHFDNVCIKPWRNNKGTVVGAFDLWERANAGRTSKIEVLALTDSFQYGIDSDRFGLDPFPIRRCICSNG